MCGGGGRCVSLPGFHCRDNTDCSIYAPICQPGRSGYCTNFSKQARGTAGNPPLEGNQGCNTNLVLNSSANLCQQISIGASCTIDAECNQGVCNTSSKTCQYATTRCSTDTTLNPQQCSPPYQCDSVSLACTIQGTTPGADGTPCNSTADCTKGSTCISGPPGAGYSGVCRSGHLTWLMLGSEDADCMTPLTGIGTDYCRYDIKNFMVCSSLADCQFPYSFCDAALSLCRTSSIDPITPAAFSYTPVGVNASAPLIVNGAFYTATYPLDQPAVDNATGGKLMTPYIGFLTSGQFQDQPGFHGRQLVTFSRYTSFCVVSIASDAEATSPSRTPYYNAIFQDPNPVLVMASIIPIGSTGNSQMWISFYSQSYSIPGLISSMNNPLGGVNFSSSDARIWNPAAISLFSPGLKTLPAFVSNPIVTPWIGVTPAGMQANNQSMMTHVLFYAHGTYWLGFFATYLAPNAGATASALLIPSLSAIQPLTPQQLIITSWDAISTQIAGTDTIQTTVLLYGISLLRGGNYDLYTVEIFFNTRDNFLFPAVTVGDTQHVPIGLATLPDQLVTPATHCRFTRASQQAVEPMLILTVFSESVSGITVTPYAVRSQGANYDLAGSNLGCSASYSLAGVASIIYVTPVTGAYNYGSFVIWCTTAETRSAFIIIQVNASCNPNLSANPFYFAPLFSAVYWRRIAADTDNYFLYPIGGASLPYFLATDTELRFDGVPLLPAA